VLFKVKEERNGPYTVTRRKVNWIGHALRKKLSFKAYNLKKDRRKDKSDGERRVIRKQLLDVFKETTGCWKLNEIALYGKLTFEETVDLS